MVIRELLYQKDMLNRKIKELKRILTYAPDNDAAAALIDLIDLRQKTINLTNIIDICKFIWYHQGVCENFNEQVKNGFP